MEGETEHVNEDSGQVRIARAFRQALQTKSAALMPYFTLGYPDLKQSLEIISAIAPFSDLMELGVPFSDPIADGPTIQRSTQIALEKGTNMTMCLQSVAELRARGIDLPFLLMGYYNPILAYGEQNLVKDAARAGVDGLIVPDLPPEESAELRTAAESLGLVLVNFLAPTSNQARIGQVATNSKGFIYMVSVTGVTGARRQMRQGLARIVADIRARADLPVAVGFGISTGEQAAQVGGYADGVIVGSALINAVEGAPDKPAAAAAYVRTLDTALRRA